MQALRPSQTRPAVLVALAALAGACTPPPEAPAELGALTRFLFANAGAEDPAALVSGTQELATYLATLDLEGNLNDRAVSLPALTADDVTGLTMPDTFDPATQVAVGVSGLSTHDLSAAIGLAVEANQVCIESNTTRYYGRTFTSDEACFADGTCATLTTANEVRKENFLANIWYDLDKDFRVVTLDDGTEVMFARSWMTATGFSDNGNGSIDQTMTIEAWIPDPTDASRTQRFYAMWSSIDLASVGDDLWANLVKSGLDEGFQNADTFLDGGDCTNDRARPYDRPTE